MVLSTLDAFPSAGPFFFSFSRILKLLRSPRIDSKEPIPHGCVVRRAGTTTLFLLPSPHRWLKNSSIVLYLFSVLPCVCSPSPSRTSSHATPAGRSFATRARWPSTSPSTGSTRRASCAAPPSHAFSTTAATFALFTIWTPSPAACRSL
jgi:hypothetical protein